MTDSPVPAVRPGRQGLWQRHRSTLLVVAGFLAALGVVLATAGGARTFERLDPDNPGADGARALARVLDREGVAVDVARGVDALESVEVSAGATVVVTSTDYLGGEVVDRLRRHVGEAEVVLVQPGTAVLAAAGIDLEVGGSAAPDGWRGDCTDPRFDELTLRTDRALAYRTPSSGTPPVADGAGCFASDEGAVLVVTDGFTVLGAGDALTNDQVLRADDAAIALRLLGGSDQLVWFVPRYEDLSADDGVSAATLLPRWIRPGLWLGALTLLALVLWRARRLGPLSTEPLPVAVKAIETTLSRGRLYRRAGDRGHAAASLRRAARNRVADRLQLGARTDEGSLVRELARRTARPEAELAALVGRGASPPPTDRDLITLASDLAALEEEVRRP